MRTITYSNFEEASLSVARFRNEGYIADCCDESAPCLWGPAAVGGVRVFVSDEPVDDEFDARLDDVLEVAPIDRLIRGMFLGLFLVGGLFCLFVVASFALGSSAPSLAHVLGVLCVSFFSLGILAILVEPMKSAIRNGLIASLIVIGLIITKLLVG